MPRALSIVSHFSTLTLHFETPRLRFEMTDATNNLRAIRQQRGLTIEHMAVLGGVHKSTISKAERGLHQLRPDTIVRLAKALKVSPKRLVSVDK